MPSLPHLTDLTKNDKKFLESNLGIRMKVEPRIMAEARSLAQTEVLDQSMELSSAPGFFVARMDDVSVLAADYFLGECGQTFKVGPKKDIK